MLWLHSVKHWISWCFFPISSVFRSKRPPGYYNVRLFLIFNAESRKLLSVLSKWNGCGNAAWCRKRDGSNFCIIPLLHVCATVLYGIELGFFFLKSHFIHIFPNHTILCSLWLNRFYDFYGIFTCDGFALDDASSFSALPSLDFKQFFFFLILWGV